MLVAQNSLGSVCPVPLTVRGNVERYGPEAEDVDCTRFRSDAGHLIPSFLGVTGLKSLTAGESSRLTADVGVSFILECRVVAIGLV